MLAMSALLGSSDAIPSQSAPRAATSGAARRTAFIHISRPTLHEKLTAMAGTSSSS